MDSLEIGHTFWRDLRDEIETHLATANLRQTILDLREVDYVDSRSAFHLLEISQLLRPRAPVLFIGPGPGLGGENGIQTP